MNNKRVLIACMPKSGSTYFSNVMEAIPGFFRAHLVPGYGRREQEICLEKLKEYEARLDVVGGGYVAQHHVRYSEVTQAYMNLVGLRPIVLVRNIFDIVCSLIDHHVLESAVYPAAFAPNDVVGQTTEEQARFITQMAVPWYFNFYMSWQECSDKIVITYEDFITKPELVLRKVCDHLGLLISEQQLIDAIQIGGTSLLRKNKVVFGRGKKLPEDCVAAINKMASYYKGVDFSSIGIGSDVCNEHFGQVDVVVDVP